MTQSQKITTINLSIPITVNRIADLLACSIEGGSNYWAAFSTPHNDFYDLAHIEWELIVHDKFTNKLYILTLQRLHNALHIMALSYPTHLKEFLNENEDAQTGDILLQLATFNSLLYN